MHQTHAAFQRHLLWQWFFSLFAGGPVRGFRSSLTQKSDKRESGHCTAAMWENISIQLHTQHFKLQKTCSYLSSQLPKASHLNEIIFNCLGLLWLHQSKIAYWRKRVNMINFQKEIFNRLKYEFESRLTSGTGRMVKNLGQYRVPQVSISVNIK